MIECLCVAPVGDLVHTWKIEKCCGEQGAVLCMKRKKNKHLSTDGKCFVTTFIDKYTYTKLCTIVNCNGQVIALLVFSIILIA